MAYEIVYSEAAEKQLNALVAYLEIEWSGKVADSFLVIFNNKLNLLQENPKLGRPLDRDPSIRKVTLTKHNLLYYTFDSTRVFLLTIFDTRQNPGKNPLE
jgi:plasmid stabilization system protein ParE